MDDLTRRGPEDPLKININQPWELEYWSHKFGISKDKLVRLVKKVGVAVSAVKKELDRERYSGWER